MAARLNAISRALAPAIRITTSSHSPIAVTARTMASSAPRTYEWLIVVPDKPGSLQKRLEVRPKHFEGLTKNVESGVFKMGGAVLEEMPADDEVSSMKFAGSTLIVVAESKEAALGYLKDDPYVHAGVWDIEKAMIWPTKIAFRKP